MIYRNISTGPFQQKKVTFVERARLKTLFLLIELQSRFGYKPLKFSAVRPQNGTAGCPQKGEGGVFQKKIGAEIISPRAVLSLHVATINRGVRTRAAWSSF